MGIRLNLLTPDTQCMVPYFLYVVSPWKLPGMTGSCNPTMALHDVPIAFRCVHDSHLSSCDRHAQPSDIVSAYVQHIAGLCSAQHSALISESMPASVYYLQAHTLLSYLNASFLCWRKQQGVGQDVLFNHFLDLHGEKSFPTFT